MVVKRYLARVAVMGIAVFLGGMVSVSFAELRIAVVDVQRAVSQSKAGKNARSMLEREKKRLERKLIEKRTVLEKKVKAIRDLQLEIQQKGAIWRSAERDRKDAELRGRRRDFSRDEDELKRMVRESRNDLSSRQRKIMGDLLRQMRDVVQAVAREGKYDLIIDKTVGGVMYVRKSVDITDQVIKLYNKKKK
jgi:outer membrane protein